MKTAIIKRVTENTLKICLISGDLDSQRKQLEALNGQQEFTTEQAMIRNAFSKFLDYLERFDNFIEAKLIGKKELKPYLIYWLEIIGNDKRQIKSEEFYNYLRNFIAFYGYSGVQNLLKRYDDDIKPKQPEK